MRLCRVPVLDLRGAGAPRYEGRLSAAGFRGMRLCRVRLEKSARGGSPTLQGPMKTEDGRQARSEVGGPRSAKDRRTLKRGLRTRPVCSLAFRLDSCTGWLTAIPYQCERSNGQMDRIVAGPGGAGFLRPGSGRARSEQARPLHGKGPGWGGWKANCSENILRDLACRGGGGKVFFAG